MVYFRRFYMALHKLVFGVANRDEKDDGANVGAYLRMGESGELVSYSSVTESSSLTFDFVDGDVTVGTDSIAESAHGLETGDIVQLTSSGTLPAGLALVTNYYVIRSDANNFKLAASLSDAEDGSAVDITAAAGGGTHSLAKQERVHQAMDVNLVNDLTISATDLDIRDLDASQDNVAISDGSDILAINGDGSINITDNGGSLTVDAVDLDIRDLSFATDSVDVSGSEVSLDAATLAALETITVLQGTSPWVIGDGGGSLTVDAVDLDIRDLTAASDSVAAWLSDGSGNAIGSTGGSLDVNVTNSIDVDDGIADTAIKQVAEVVGTSSGQIVDGADELASRKYLFIYNNSNRDAFIGDSGVSAANGFPIPAGSILETRIGPAVDVHMIGDAANMDIRTLQLS